MDRSNDVLIDDFLSLVRNRDTGFVVPELTESMVSRALSRVGIDLEPFQEIFCSPDVFIREFILNGQKRILQELSRAFIMEKSEEEIQR